MRKIGKAWEHAVLALLSLAFVIGGVYILVVGVDPHPDTPTWMRKTWITNTAAIGCILLGGGCLLGPCRDAYKEWKNPTSDSDSDE